MNEFLFLFLVSARSIYFRPGLRFQRIHFQISRSYSRLINYNLEFKKKEGLTLLIFLLLLLVLALFLL